MIWQVNHPALRQLKKWQKKLLDYEASEMFLQGWRSATSRIDGSVGSSFVADALDDASKSS